MGQQTPPILLVLVNMCYVAAEQGFIWTIRTNGDSIAFVDEHTGQEKMIITNPDEDTKLLAKEIDALGWHLVKQKYLTIDDEWVGK